MHVKETTSCGLDFGTSNTTLGIATGTAHAALIALEGDAVTVPSAVFYAADGATQIGAAAIDLYVDGVEGRLMRSLKSVVGSTLIDERTAVARRRIRFRDIIANFISAVRQRAQTRSNHELQRVVHGRPVFFVDDDAEANAQAEEQLKSIAHAAGFSEVSFQFEPIAAALDYERQVVAEEIALIADIGGGTSDFSIVRLGPHRHRRDDRSADILANDGVRIGGTDFDRQLSLNCVMPLLGYGSPMKAAGRDVPRHFFFDLATWSSINRLYAGPVLRELRQIAREAARPELIERLVHVIEAHRGHTVAIEVEKAKIAASEHGRGDIDLGWLERGMTIGLSRDLMAQRTDDLATRIAGQIGMCLRKAGLTGGQIDALFLTGGSTQLPHVRGAIRQAVPKARVVSGDIFGSVGTGLALEAVRRYGT